MSDDALPPRLLLENMFAAAIAAAQPATCLPPFLPPPPKGKFVVFGAGKASAAMAKAVEDHWDGPLSGLVVTRGGYEVPCKHIEIVRASHPVPDAAGEAAARRMMAMAQDLGPDDLALCLISGGGSALLPLPAPGLTLAEKQDINRKLLASGAPISDINCVRRHLSGIKGGRLAAACYPARVLTLLISDVPGDDPVNIASGPTVADPTTCADARAILKRYGIDTGADVLDESIKPGDARLAGIETQLIATPRLSLDAAAAIARAQGLTPVILGGDIEGDAAQLGRDMAQDAIKRSMVEKQPFVLLSGGETTVTVRGKGRGGRNVEFLLSMAQALNGAPDIYALAGDTDGVDGTDDIAGAFISPDTLARAAGKGIDAEVALQNNDAHSFFEKLGDSVVTGPTFTNINDFRAVLVTKG